jgi:hypothetical protein
VGSVNDWVNTVLVSALTSAVVALGIEWLAKPRLEARKERLLRLHRARQTFEANVVTVLANSAKVSAASEQPLPDDLSDVVRRAIRDEISRVIQQIDDATREMSDKLVDYEPSYPTPRARSLIVQYVATTRGIQLSDKAPGEKAEILKQITAPLHTWLFTRWWRLRSRYSAFQELPRLLHRYDPEGGLGVGQAKTDGIRAAGDPPADDYAEN